MRPEFLIFYGFAASSRPPANYMTVRDSATPARSASKDFAGPLLALRAGMLLNRAR
jgi:hypothetical protein